MSPADPGLPGERDRILEAFVRLAASRGLAGLAPGDVWLEAGLGPTDFYRHFEDLDVCFDAAWDDLEEGYLRRMSAVDRGFGEGGADLRAAIAETFRLVEEHPTAARFMTIETLGAGGRERRRQQRLVAGLVDLLDAAIARSDGPAASQTAPAWILATLFARIYSYLLGGTRRSLSEQVDEAMLLAEQPFRDR